jgi:hypothetical protein
MINLPSYVFKTNFGILVAIIARFMSLLSINFEFYVNKTWSAILSL